VSDEKLTERPKQLFIQGERPSEIRARQERLFPFENPLKTKFTSEFFRALPQKPGVYRMLGQDGALLYVGKAKNLRNRLRSYRQAKPEQVSRKVIRMVSKIERIEWEVCESEAKALLLENRLLRKHRPPFNVTNTSPESYYFIALTVTKCHLKFRLTTDPDPECEDEILFGTYKGRATVRDGYGSLLRLCWAAFCKSRARRFEYPGVLVRRRVPYEYTLQREVFEESDLREAISLLKRFLNGTSKALLGHLTERILLNEDIPRFQYHFVQSDLEQLAGFYQAGPWRNKRLRKHHGIEDKVIAQDEIDDLLVTFRFRD